MKLAEALQAFFLTAKNPVLFAGAGVSMRVGLPSWPKLLKDIANQIRDDDPLAAAHIDQAVASNQLLYAATIFDANPALTPVAKRKILRKLLSQENVDRLRSLASLPVSAIATTNFDRTLSNAYAAALGKSAIEYHYGSAEFISTTLEQEFFISRIHGRIEGQEPIVFTDSQYQHALVDPHYLDVIRYLFTQRTLLIVGFSFLDPALQAVLSAVEKMYGGRSMGEHLALLPEDADDSFVSKLARYNIRKITYSHADNHAELWQAIDEFVSSKNGTKSPSKELSPPTVQMVGPLDPMKRFLAATFARLDLRQDAETLRNVTFEGVILGTIIDEEKGISLEELHGRLNSHFGLDRQTTNEILKSALEKLRGEKLVTRQKQPNRGDVFFKSDEVVVNPLQVATESLGRAVVDRIKVMFGVGSTSDMRTGIANTIQGLIESRGWDLGAAFIHNSTPPDIDIEHHVRDGCRLLTQAQLNHITSAMKHLLVSPTPAEAKLLAEIGRVSFSIALIFAAPRTAISHGSLLPERVYLDASVLLPALVPGHKFHDLYQSTIRALHKISRKVGRTFSVLVYDGYLNEVVSHRRRAVSEYEMEGEGFNDFAIRLATLDGPQNMNVYIGAFAQHLLSEPTLDFSEFLARYAPYRTENELEQYIKKLNILTLKKNEIIGDGYSEISFELTKAYAQDGDRIKNPTLIEHDAVQLSALEREASKGLRSIWVTADKKLKQKLVAARFDAIADQMISHFGLAELVDFVSDYEPSYFGAVGLLWGVAPSDETSRVREFLVNKALQSYDEAYAMEMQELVGDISQAYQREAERQGISLDSKNPSSRVKALHILGGFENDFFEALRKKIELRERQGSA
ncbi:SIR2 family protein [Rhodoferax sp.]|uniref:SIR2 family protein n=1 Tax=Rhodoferax sp. TaxID=50421 RepID=UPI0025CE700D|nr:SIR2 family protein [Rhodoferax sp.]MCM2297022.1 SIR2 family protein [Rhodoferax sp.]